MKSVIFVSFILLSSVFPLFILAQRVVYSPPVGDQSTTRFEVLGKAADFYWIQKSRKRGSRKKSAEPWINDKHISFEIYDARMNLVNSVPTMLADSAIKQYFIAGNLFLDQLTFIKAHNKTTALLNRYAANGDVLFKGDTLFNFPGNMRGGDFLLVRSQDKSKMLLLGFESLPDSPARLYATLYDKDWKPLFTTIRKDRNISQPYVQYDFINYPLEDFNTSPVKLSNNGEWLMLSPSGTSNNYLILHFYGLNDGFEHDEIPLPDNARLAELTLTVDNEKHEAVAGILLNTGFPSIKKVRVVQYLLSECRVKFDTSYRLNTLAGNKTRNENLVQEYFMAVPGKGFMFLKEYGRYHLPFDQDDDSKRQDHLLPERNTVVNKIHVPVNKDDYTRYNDLAGSRSHYDRGDLSLYYFPATKNDSCWSGILNKQQLNELNSSYLSYVFMPVENKLMFIYNSLFNGSNEYSSTTVLDQEGNPLNEGLVFWKANNNLLFQKARQISGNELSIPYEKNMRNGFAIIRL